MTLIYYDAQMPSKNLNAFAQRIKETVGDEVLFLPKDFDAILKASEEQLLSAKNAIEAALALKKDN